MVKIQVKILTSNGCQLCARAKDMIRSAAQRSGVDLDLVELSIDDPDPKPAIDHAIAEGLDHIPSFKIGGRVFVEDRFVEGDLYDAFRSVNFGP